MVEYLMLFTERELFEFFFCFSTSLILMLSSLLKLAVAAAELDFVDENV